MTPEPKRKGRPKGSKNKNPYPLKKPKGHRAYQVTGIFANRFKVRAFAERLDAGEITE